VSESAPLFLDRSLGAVVVAEALREAGEAVEVHDDHFAQDAPDEEWLPEVARRGWIAVTKDNAIRRGFLQRLAVAQAGARLFVFTPGKMTGPEMGAALVTAAPTYSGSRQFRPRRSSQPSRLPDGWWSGGTWTRCLPSCREWSGRTPDAGDLRLSTPDPADTPDTRLAA
jgi:hypothetical protein